MTYTVFLEIAVEVEASSEREATNRAPAVVREFPVESISPANVVGFICEEEGIAVRTGRKAPVWKG